MPPEVAPAAAPAAAPAPAPAPASTPAAPSAPSTSSIPPPREGFKRSSVKPNSTLRMDDQKMVVPFKGQPKPEPKIPTVATTKPVAPKPAAAPAKPAAPAEPGKRPVGRPP